MKIGHSAI